MSNKFYVYILRDPRRDDQPFYVGKGEGTRAKDHLTENKQIKGSNPWKYSKIQAIRRAGLEPLVEYYSANLPEDEAYELETQLIKLYGRAGIDEGGILTNRCLDARPPVQSGPMSQSKRDAIAAGNRGKKRTAEQSAYLSEIRRGKKRGVYSEEHRDNIRRALTKSEFPDDLTGLVFGQWTVISRVSDRRDLGARGRNAEYWLCRCSCPKKMEREVCRRSLERGTSTGCGGRSGVRTKSAA